MGAFYDRCMTLTEWVKTRAEIASALQDAGDGLGADVAATQQLLATAVAALYLIDDRLIALEAKAGFSAFDLAAK